VVYSLASGKLFTWFIAPGTKEGHIQYISRLRSRVAQVGESVSLETIRSRLGRTVIWGHMPSQILREGDTGQVRNAAHSCAEKARSLGIPLFLSPSGPVEPATPIENIAAISSALEKI